MTRADGTPADPAVGAFGRWLLQERELRGLRRDEVARLTKLGPAIIEALESGDPGRMPPRAYVCGYLRAYAAVVGLDADDVVLRWQEVAGAEEEGVRQPRPRPVTAAKAVVAVVAALVALALAALAALALFGATNRERAPLKLDRPRAVDRGPYQPPTGR
ncbi:MAG TPA: helix-turn-helix transcriptional regulator [Anaeromyxobacteraceae bacterium]